MNSQPDKEEAADTVLNALLPFLKAASKREPSGETGKVQPVAFESSSVHPSL